MSKYKKNKKNKAKHPANNIKKADVVKELNKRAAYVRAGKASDTKSNAA